MAFRGGRHVDSGSDDSLLGFGLALWVLGWMEWPLILRSGRIYFIIEGVHIGRHHLVVSCVHNCHHISHLHYSLSSLS